MYSSNAEITGIMHDKVPTDGWIAMFDASITPLWAKRWPESTTLIMSGGGSWYSLPKEHSLCYDLAFDATNSLFGVGKQCGEPCNGAMSKMAISDGAQVWEKVFTDMQYIARITLSNDGSGDFFVHGMLYTTDGKVTAANPTPFGVSCDVESCGLVARMTSDGALVWARTIKGAHFQNPYGSSLVYGNRLELDATGAPYIYVVMGNAAKFGPVTVDSGTPYAGCKDDTTGVVTPAYEIDTTKMVTATDCPSGSTFVDTDSADAVWAASAQTDAYCAGPLGYYLSGWHGDCIMKYHAFTGLPMWAKAISFTVSIVPMPDGTLHAIGRTLGSTFGAVKTPDSNQWQYPHFIIDSAGVGMSVQIFTNPKGAYAELNDMIAASDGDLYVTGYMRGTALRFDDSFTMTWPAENSNMNVFLFKLGASGPKVKPSCISTCTDDASTTVIDANSCYIDGICYADGDGVPAFSRAHRDGQLCQICDVTQSQTSWSEDPTIVGVSECFIDGVCYKGNYSGVDADWFSHTPEGESSPAISMCQYCDQFKDKNAWSVADDYEVVSGMSPPNDCQFTATRGVNTGESDGASTLGSGGQGLFALALASRFLG